MENSGNEKRGKKKEERNGLTLTGLLMEGPGPILPSCPPELRAKFGLKCAAWHEAHLKFACVQQLLSFPAHSPRVFRESLTPEHPHSRIASLPQSQISTAPFWMRMIGRTLISWCKQTELMSGKSAPLRKLRPCHLPMRSRIWKNYRSIAWPYGLVVAVGENGVRAPDDAARIKRNREELVRLLEEAGVRVELLPSA
jgi:hypothetical protein